MKHRFYIARPAREQTKVLAVIPARAGSKGLPHKNLKRLGDKSLLEWAISSARQSQRIHRTVVSTEDERIARVARQAGCEVPFRRPSTLATDTASVWDTVRHAALWLEKHAHWRADIVVLLQPTTPFRTGKHIDQTIRALTEKQTGSAMTVRRVDYPPQWMFTLGREGRMTRIVKQRYTLTRRQDSPHVFQPSGAVYAVRRKLLMRGPQLPQRDTCAVPMSFEDSINIDMPWQFELAERMLKRPSLRHQSL